MCRFVFRHIWILFLLTAACKTVEPETKPWHGIRRSVRYSPEGDEFVIVNGDRRFNRAIYGTNTGFRVEAGDLPEFAMYLPGMGGNLKFGIGRDGKSKWLIESERITARYRPGAMLYEISDPMLGRGLLKIRVLAMAEEEGMILELSPENIGNGAELFWAYGGVSGKKFSRDGDIGADPESVFYLKPGYCTDNAFTITDNSFRLQFNGDRFMDGVFPAGCELRISDAGRQQDPLECFASGKGSADIIAGRISLTDADPLYFCLRVQGDSGNLAAAYRDLPAIMTRAEEERERKAGRIVVETPDPHINTIGGALGIAADAIWEDPAYLHGAVAWRMHLAGWRGAYAGDWLGWHDRARRHFSAYAASQYTSPESAPAIADPKTNLSRQVEEHGNAMFTSGYISRRPGGINKPHHYDMNLVFIDQLLWHFLWTGDLEFAREMWPLIERHFAWEKRCFDTDGDGLYNAYCCIWASDALQYSGGAVTHSSAYNYRANALAARIAERIGEDPEPFRREAEKIRSAVNDQLWLNERGWYAEFRDEAGLRLLHTEPAVWTLYHALDAELADPFQAYQCTRYLDKEIPHIPIIASGMPEGEYHTLSTSNWMPYTWSVNNVALAENLNTCLAYWQAGRKEEAFRLWKSQFLESMYLGASPGNFQQLSFYDAFRGELYRDFADPVGMAARTLVEGLFGILPDALDSVLTIRPGFPEEWDHASIRTPDIELSFQRSGKKDRYTVRQNLPVEMDINLELSVPSLGIRSVRVNGQITEWENIPWRTGRPVIGITVPMTERVEILIEWQPGEIPEPVCREILGRGERTTLDFSPSKPLQVLDPQGAAGDALIRGKYISFTAKGLNGHRTFFVQLEQENLQWWYPVEFELREAMEITRDTVPGLTSFRISNYSSSPADGNFFLNRSLLPAEPAAGQDPGQPAPSEGGIKITVHGSISVPVLESGLLVPGTNLAEFRSDSSNITGKLIDWGIRADPSTSWNMVDLGDAFNDRVTSIFKNRYLSPRSQAPTLQLPVQGVGDWCSYNLHPEIDDRGLRARAGEQDRIVLDQGIPLSTPGDSSAANIIYTSRWDNYPDEVRFPLGGKASHAYLLMAGSVHHMESRMTNGVVRIRYTDGTCDSLELVHPDSWWPIEQDYYTDGYAFRVDAPKPPRIWLKTGEQKQGDYEVMRKNGTNDIPGGAASVFDLPLDPSKELRELSLETLANDVVIGLMSLTLARE